MKNYMANNSHSRCFATTKYTQKEPFYSQIVGHLQVTPDGRWFMEDCDGNEMPLGEIVKQYEGKHICLNINNLIVPNGNWDIQTHYEGR